MIDQEQLDVLLDRWMDSRFQGNDATAAELCAEYPHLRAELERRAHAFQAVDALRLPREATGTGVSGAATTDFEGGAAIPVSDIAFSPPQRADELGRLAGYRILKPLGEGGMGGVYLAEHWGRKRLAALKVMRPAAAAVGQAKERFLREAQTAASVKHEHIVTIYDVGEENGVPFIAMEHLEGETLDQR